MRLSHKDFDALHRVMVELYEPRSLAAFQQALPRIALKIIPADTSTWAKYRFEARTSMMRMVSYTESASCFTRQLIDASERHLATHPMTEYFARTKDVTALKLSDFLSLRRLKSSWIWTEVMQPIGGKYHLGVSTNTTRGTASAINLVAKSKDFTERDRLILNLLRPHIIQAGRTAQLMSALQNIQASPTSPVPLGETYRLSPREREVANWVMEGKSNPEIAIILGTSPRTIEKHMENILAKLGVENRTALATALTRANGRFCENTQVKAA